MKNYILKTLIMVVAALLSFSCNDSFLEKGPLDKISDGSFWNTENDLIVYNNSLYNLVLNDDVIPIFMGHDDGFDSQKYGIWYLDGFSDNTAPLAARSFNFQQIRAGKQIIPNNGGAQWFGWKGWNFVRAINVGMDNYGRASVPDVVRNKYIGEARFMRGWFYADKISKFGTAQWVESEVSVDDEDILNGTRDSRDLVMGKVLEDLNFATANLPANWGDGNAPGRINRWGALLIKSRVALFEGTWRKYHGLAGADTWLQAAADAAKELMDDGPYSLFDNGDHASSSYNALHRMENIAGNPEVIYWRRYERGIFTNHAMNYWRSYNGGATKSMVEDYLDIDGLPITLSDKYLGDASYKDIFVDRDPRLRQSIMHPDDQQIYGYGNHPFATYSYPRIQGMPGGQNSTTGYHIIKVFQNTPAYAGYNSSITPAITMRFAEALLNYAEATAELGGGVISQADLDVSINKLRDRVGMPHLVANPPMDPRYASDGISAVLVEIRRERRVELFIEGFRYDDLRRWKQGKKLEVKDYGMRWDAANIAAIPGSDKTAIKVGLVNDIPYLEPYKGTDFENPVFDEAKDYLWPIPIESISQNPNLGQNPGWGE
jgi:starch-binding outer membrane protein, SusD/RagB family